MSTTQPYATMSDALHDWLQRHVAEGFEADPLVASMVQSGYDRAFARRVVDEALAKRPPAPAVAPVPAPAAQSAQAADGAVENSNAVRTADGDIPILFALETPRIVLFQHFLSDEECDQLIALGQHRLKRSPVVNPETGEENLISARTSEGAMFQVGEHALIAKIEARIAQATGVPVEHGEGFQVLHYQPGGEYQPHFDFFNPGRSGEARQLEVGGQRVATLVIYLNSVQAGGATGFPKLGLEVAPRWILLVTLAMVVVLVITFAAFLAPTMLSPGSRWTLIACAVVFAVVFGFLVAAACGYMAGLIGSSSSPISGIGMIAITLVSLLLLAVGADNGIVGSPEASKLGIALAIFTTSAVVAVATISNDNLQDLKTGWLVGATPWRQQVALLVGCVAGAAVISPVLELLYNAYGFPGALPRAGMDAAQALSAPQATLMTAIATGIFTHKLEWNMVITGTIVGAILIAIDWVLKRRGGAARLPVLAVGIGIYLPPTVSAPLVIGAVLAWVIEKILARRAQAAGVPYERYAEVPNRHGVLLASGLIVGESLVGVLMAAIIGTTGTDAPLAIVGASFESAAQWLGLIVFALICWAFARRVLAVRPAH